MRSTISPPGALPGKASAFRFIHSMLPRRRRAQGHWRTAAEVGHEPRLRWLDGLIRQAEALAVPGVSPVQEVAGAAVRLIEEVDGAGQRQAGAARRPAAPRGGPPQDFYGGRGGPGG